MPQAVQSVPQGQRLVARRGSRSAPDPFAQHIDADKSRHVRSRLTLVCVPSPVEDPSADIAAPTRIGRSQSTSATLTPRSRMSFSTASFASAEDPVTRRQSHSVSGPGRRSSQQVVRRPTLTAQQICDLASNSLADHDDAIPKSPFRAVPASYHLPFIQRVEEVTALLSHPPNARLMTLVSLTFPLHNRNVPGEFTEDATEWSFTTLIKYITTVDRSAANDVEWISKVRKSIRSHNEAMWERVRDVLGVLPELDADEYNYSRPSQVVENTSSLGGDGGGQSKGEQTNDEAWLEPVFPEKSKVKFLADSLPGGMTPIGEEDEPQGEPGDGEPQESEEVELEEVDVKGEAQRSPKKISALRINTAYQFLPGTVPTETKVEQIASSARPLSTASTDEAQPEEHSITTPPLANSPNAEQGQAPYADSPGMRDKHDNALAPRSALARRWSSHHDIERPSLYPISPIIKILPKRRQSVEVAPRFPTTFAKLSPVETPSLARQFVYAGTVH